MSDHQAEPGGGTGGRYSVPQAARYLGISERAVRKRITAGTLPASKQGQQWVVFMHAEPDAVQEAVPGGTTNGPGGGTGAVPPEPEPIEASYRISPHEIEQAIERTGDKYVADMASIFDRVDALYRDQIAAKDETIAELRRRAEAAESRVSELEQRQAELPPQGETTPPERPQRSWWRFWERV